MTSIPSLILESNNFGDPVEDYPTNVKEDLDFAGRLSIAWLHTVLYAHSAIEERKSHLHKLFDVPRL